MKLFDFFNRLPPTRSEDVDVVHDFSGLSLQYKAEPLDDFIQSLPGDITPDDLKDRPWGARYLYLRDPLGIQVVVYEGCW